VRTAIIGIVSIVSLFLSLMASGPAQSQVKPKAPSSATQTPSPSPPETSPTQTKEAPGEDDVIRVSTNLVTSNALVIGRDRKYLPSLRSEDFHVFENGVEQEIAYFAPIDRPFIVALVIDNSRSTTFELQQIKDAAIAFVNQIRPNDRALIISLTDDFKATALATNNQEALIQSISNIKRGGATRLYDAVDFAIKQVLASMEARKAIILLTDGVDNDSQQATQQSNLNDAANSAVPIYAVQLSTYVSMSKQAARSRRPPPEGSGFSRVDYQRADAYLHQMTQLTGASLYPAARVSDLDRAVAGIADELHNEYTLGFYPRVAGKPGEVRRLDVRVNQPWLTVRARRSYSFGPVLTTRSVNKAMPAPLSAIESPSASQIASEDRRPLGARWICKGPFVPGDYALVKEGYDAKCPASTRANDRTNAWFIRKPGPSETVCKGYLSWNGSEVEVLPIPAGYAVIGEVKSAVCSPSNDPKRHANAWKVKRPSSAETVCKGFLIPRGFVIVNEKKATTCPPTSTDANAWVIVPTHDIETRRFWPVP